MSEEKRLEIEIGWYKVVFAILVVTDISLLAWVAQNVYIANNILLVFSLIAIAFVTLGIYLINKRVFKCLDRIEEI
ncbi:hypothetical protein [Thiomicrospira microaerophila]|uniref:hypothetical protein n=1 Tax=Thiomicrospira microaerophila TaxID=406020 RepID=UPI0005C9DEE7|nr:hypothetical protein [Thiomicrospira microaerophila]